MNEPGLAFLQNMWVRNPERLKATIARAEARDGSGEELRSRMIEYALFAGCPTGRRLKAAFGEWIEQIAWDETTREIAGDPKTIFPPDPQHIEATIRKYQPRIIFAFGKIAAESVFQVLQATTFSHAAGWPRDIEFVTAPHPAARQPDTIRKLKEAAEKFKPYAR